jgi:hypothetical protein
LKELEFYKQWHTRRVLHIPPVNDDVAFRVGWNPTGENSYWTAVSQIIYGLPKYWPWVKAQHTMYMRGVLADQNHPRHEIYQTIGREVNIYGETTLRALDTPGGCVPDEIYQVTADLYDIYLVRFTMHKSRPDAVIHVTSRGCWNTRHRFLMLSNESHYEPVTPFVKRPSEFQYPELSSSSLHPGQRIRRHVRREADDPLIGYSYRKHSSEEEVPEQLIPRPTIPLPSEADIAGTITGLLPPRALSANQERTSNVPSKTDSSKKNTLSRKLYKATRDTRITPAQVEENRAIYETLSYDILRAFCDCRGIEISPYRNSRQNLIDDLIGDDAVWTNKRRTAPDPLLDFPTTPTSSGHPPLTLEPEPLQPTPDSLKPAWLTVDEYMKWTWNQLYGELKERDYAAKTGNKLYKLTKKLQMAKALVDLDQGEMSKEEHRSAKAGGRKKRRGDEEDEANAQDTVREAPSKKRHRQR